jgi:alkylation response protein AidB-like acyl-CoA dehydrogenase
MSFILGQSAEQRMLAESLRRVVNSANDFEKRRRRLSQNDPDRMALWRPLADMGALGVTLPESRGGFGGTPVDLATVAAALAPSLLVEPIVSVAVVAACILSAAEGDGVDALIGGTIAGERIPILVHSEGFDPFAQPGLCARKTGGGYALDGVKPAARHADVATDLLVSARLDDGSTGIFVVNPQRDGVGLERLRMIDAAGAADLTFENVAATPNSLLTFSGGAMAAILDALEWTLGALCVETAALVGAANTATFEYLKVRQQFGQPLAKFQALQHRTADMSIAQAEAEALAMDALDALAAPPSDARTRRILLASLGSDAAGRLVAHEAIQLHGGMGVSDELIVSHYGRRFAAIRNQIASIDARQARILSLGERAQ